MKRRNFIRSLLALLPIGIAGTAVANTPANSLPLPMASKKDGIINDLIVELSIRAVARSELILDSEHADLVRHGTQLFSFNYDEMEVKAVDGSDMTIRGWIKGQFQLPRYWPTPKLPT